MKFLYQARALFFSCKIAWLYNLLPPHPRFNSLSIRFMLQCFQSAFSPLEDLPTRIRSFRVKDLDDVRVSSSFVRPRCPFWAFALWLFESRALRKGWFPECYRVSGISVEQVEIATAFCPFRRVQLRPHINESLRELENINGSKKRCLMKVVNEFSNLILYNRIIPNWKKICIPLSINVDIQVFNFF